MWSWYLPGWYPPYFLFWVLKMTMVIDFSCCNSDTLGVPPMGWYFPAFHLEWSLPLVKHSATPGLYSVSSHPTTLGGVTQPPLPYVILIPPFPAKKLFWCNLRFQNGFGNWFFILYGYPLGLYLTFQGDLPPVVIDSCPPDEYHAVRKFLSAISSADGQTAPTLLPSTR